MVRRGAGRSREPEPPGRSAGRRAIGAELSGVDEGVRDLEPPRFRDDQIGPVALQHAVQRHRHAGSAKGDAVVRDVDVAPADQADRPPDVFGGTTTLHFGPDRQPYLLLPIIPPK